MFWIEIAALSATYASILVAGL